MDRITYIKEVISNIKGNSTKIKIQYELNGHIDDRMEYYLDAGYDKEYAEQEAIKRMGSPAEVARDMQKLHNNTFWVVLSIVFALFYIAGLVFANIKSEFAFINIVDWDSAELMPCAVSTLIFLALALSFLFAKKSENSTILVLLGILSIATPVLSMYALLPFGYQIVGFVTDFPASIITKQRFFGYFEPYNHLDDLFPQGIPEFLYYPLIILPFLISFICVIIGIASIIYGLELSRNIPNKTFEKRINRFSAFIIALALITAFGTTCEAVYSNAITTAENERFLVNEGTNIQLAKDEFDKIKLPMTSDEVLAYANELGLDEYYTSEMKYNMITIYENEACFVQLNDNDENGIYENKRICIGAKHFVDNETINEISKLQVGSSIDDLFNILRLEQLSEYQETVNGDEIETYIDFFDNVGDSYYLIYTNSELTGFFTPDSPEDYYEEVE